MKYLIEGTDVPLQVGQTGFADRVAASETDWQTGLEFKPVLTNRTDEKVGPLRRLDRHREVYNLMLERPLANV